MLSVTHPARTRARSGIRGATMVPMADEKQPAEKQHEPTAAERDERVSLHPEKGENVLKRLLGVPADPPKKSRRRS